MTLIRSQPPAWQLFAAAFQTGSLPDLDDALEIGRAERKAIK
jgi:hypothetical protein